LKLGTKLTVYLSLIIVIVLSGYGYFHILSRREILVRKMKVEVESTGRNLKVSLEKVQIPREREYVQDLIDGIEEYEKTLGVIVYHQGKDLVFNSRSLGEGIEPYLNLVKRSIKEDLHQEEFGVYRKVPIFTYAFPLKDKKGKNIGGVSILQHTSFMEDDIKRAEWNILITVLILIGGIVAIVLMGTRKWISQPISLLVVGINHIAKGNLDTRIDIRRKDEISQLAGAFNQMAVDLKKAQQEVIQQADAKVELERSLRQSEKLGIIGKLASELAHEIRTPLTSIKIFIQSLEKEIDMDGNREEDFGIIKKEIDRINENITRLLNFARPEEPQFQEINVHELLKDTLNLLMTKIQNNKIQLDISFLNAHPQLKGDPKQLTQVFLNLLLNAIEAMPQGGTLAIRSSIETNPDNKDKFFQIVIQDTGQGIPESDIPHLFEPFFTTKKEGTGLGLSIVNSLIQKHRGQIEVESEWGRGSSFILTLPIRKEASWEE